MTTATPSNPSRSTVRNNSTPEGDDRRRPTREASPQDAETFAQLLRLKASRPDADAPEPGAAGLFPPSRSELPQPLAGPPAPAGVQAAAPSATADALRCAQVHGAAPAAPTTGAAATPSRWDVQLGDPLAGGLQLRATTPAATPAALVPAAPTWELSLASSQIGAQTLARHAPRLSERLRARGVDHHEVQVQDSRQRHTPQDDRRDELA